MSEYEVASRMQRHDLHKLHGLGNDFLVWFQPEVPDNAGELAQRWCNRSSGIGADGLIVAIDRRIEAQFVLFNSDGGRSEISGNGLRCFAHAVARRRGLDELQVDAVTDVGPRPVQVTSALSLVASASVAMGSVAAGPAPLPIDPALGVVSRSIETADIGNPHVVIEVDDAMAHDMAVVGPAIEADYMPTGINVHLVTPTETGIVMNIWERGAGVTQACGSGASAAAAVLARSRPEQTEFTVTMPGGAATVHVDADEIVLAGPSTYVAAIVLGADHG